MFLKRGEKMFTLSKNELDVVTLLWQEGRALSRTEIIELSTKKTWKASSIHILLNSLLKKGAIKVEGFVQTGKNYGRTYAAAVTQEEYAAMQFTKNVPSQTVNKENLPKLFTALINADDVDRDLLNELQMIIDQKKGELSE
jgi:predicted transcriptional regulator